ncbi:hypothetical protein [Tomitella biformata]|uniref:hypothetical protein n=1 Tax=Tomitella biformata TaxID=630403 RepID=UPI0004B49D8D|nr:hypothetical protein [Tomitella biformata]
MPVTLSSQDLVAVSAVPTREELLDKLPRGGTGPRIVVIGGDAALAAVLTHLMRHERLDVELAFVPESRTPACKIYRLDHGSKAAKRALDGEARATPLIRDDLGVALVGSAVLSGPDGGKLTGETYVDNFQLFTGIGPGVEIRPLAKAPGLEAARVGGLRRKWARGRAAQTGAVSARLVRDGILERKQLKRSTFYRDANDWLLVR